MKNKTFRPLIFKLQQEDGKWQQILRSIDASKSMRGVKVTKKDLEMMIENFNANILDLKPNELQVNYSHDSHEIAAGWITELRINGRFLEAKIRWTPKAKQMIEDEEFRFFSAEFAPNWENVETQEVHQNMLLGAALTNIPFVPGMKAVALSDIDTADDGIFIFPNNSEMKLFTELLSALQGNKEVSLAEAKILRTMFDALEKEEQTEDLATSVAAVETLAQTNQEAAEKLAAEAKAEAEKLAADLEAAKVELSAKTGGSEAMTKLQNELKLSQSTTKALQSQVDKMALDARTKEITARVEALCTAGKILPKDKQATIDLAIAQGKEENQEKFLSYLDAMPAKIDFSETGSGSDADLNETAQIKKINQLAQEAFAKDKSKTLAEHIAHFTRELS